MVTIRHTKGPGMSHVQLLDSYLSKVPPSEIIKDINLFYLSPLPFTPLRSMPWYFNEPIQSKKLKTMLKDMCKQASVTGNYTSHSLHAMGATVLWFSENTIQKHTGHKSVNTLRVYERTTEKENLRVSQVLNETANFASSVAVQLGKTPEESSLDLFEELDQFLPTDNPVNKSEVLVS